MYQGINKEIEQRKSTLDSTGVFKKKDKEINKEERKNPSTNPIINTHGRQR